MPSGWWSRPPVPGRRIRLENHDQGRASGPREVHRFAMLFAIASNAAWALRSVAGPATVGVLLSAAVVARLAAADPLRPRAWASALAGLGFAVYLAWQLAVLFVLPTGNMDLAVFYRAGREAAAGRDPYLFRGEMVFLSPPPALGAFRLASALPYPVVGAAWAIASALMTVALVPLANRLLALDHAADLAAAPPALPADLTALLGAALVNSNASIWGHRSGQLCALTAFALTLALLARQRGRPALAGVCLAVAAFKPATLIPFLVLFLRKADVRTWLALAACSLGLSLAAAPPRVWKTLVAHDLEKIDESGRPGGINDYDFPRAISSDILAFNHLFHRAGVHDRGVISGLQSASVGLLLGGLYLTRGRRPFTAAASLAAVGSMLVLYHRMYDAVVFALPLAYGSALAVRAAGRRRVLAVGCVALLLGVIDQPRETLIPLTRWSLEQGIAGRFVQAVVLPYAAWSILIALAGLTLCAFPPRNRISARPAVSDHARGGT